MDKKADVFVCIINGLVADIYEKLDEVELAGSLICI